MLSMILQLGALADLIQGITAAAVADTIDAEYKDSKFGFWCYRNKISVTASKNLGYWVYKTLHS
jgi:hypothetical protein